MKSSELQQYRCGSCGVQSKDGPRFTRHYRQCPQVHSLDKMLLNLISHKSFKSRAMKIQFPPLVTWNKTSWNRSELDHLQLTPNLQALWGSNNCLCGYIPNSTTYDVMKHVYVCNSYSWSQKRDFVQELRNLPKLVFPSPLSTNKDRFPTIIVSTFLF